MPKKKTQDVTADGDLRAARALLSKRGLDAAVAKLDPDDVSGTLDAVPHEVIRLLTALHASDDIEKQVRAVAPPDRKVLRALLKSSKKHKAGGFLTALAEEASADPAISKRLGVSLVKRQSGTSTEEKIENAITAIADRPHLMLKNSQLYCTLSFFQNDELLFQSDLELHRLVMMSRAILGAADNCLEMLEQNAKGVKPQIDDEHCRSELKAIGKLTRDVGRRLDSLDTARPRIGRKKKTRRKRA